MTTKRSENRLRKQDGMTLMEILIVLAIVGSLMALIMPKIMNQMEQSKIKTTKLAMSSLINDINLYYADCGKYPSSLENLTTADSSCSNWGPEPYTKKLPKDAWNKDFNYSSEGGNFTITSLGADGREGGDGKNKDISSEDLN